MNKYKALGYLIIFFVIFFMWLILKPDRSVYVYLLDSRTIDSISISHRDTFLVLKSEANFKRLIQLLKQSARVEIDRENINYDHIDIQIFQENKLYFIRLLFNTYHGKVLHIEESYFKNDSFVKEVTMLLQYIPADFNMKNYP